MSEGLGLRMAMAYRMQSYRTLPNFVGGSTSRVKHSRPRIAIIIAGTLMSALIWFFDHMSPYGYYGKSFLSYIKSIIFKMTVNKNYNTTFKLITV